MMRDDEAGVVKLQDGAVGMIEKDVYHTFGHIPCLHLYGIADVTVSLIYVAGDQSWDHSCSPQELG